MVDTNLAAKRLGLAQEEEVESVKRLVKAVPSEALFICVSALWDQMCACTLLLQVLCKRVSWASAEGRGRGGGFSSLPECRQMPEKTLLNTERKLPYDLCLIVKREEWRKSHQLGERG